MPDVLIDFYIKGISLPTPAKWWLPRYFLDNKWYITYPEERWYEGGEEALFTGVPYSEIPGILLVYLATDTEPLDDRRLDDFIPEPRTYVLNISTMKIRVLLPPTPVSPAIWMGLGGASFLAPILIKGRSR